MDSMMLQPAPKKPVFQQKLHNFPLSPHRWISATPTETLVVDLDDSQQRAVDHIVAGESLVVSAPPGTGQTQTAVGAAVGLAQEGKRVLVVAENTSTLSEFSNR